MILGQALRRHAFDRGHKVPRLSFRDDLCDSRFARGFGESGHIEHREENQRDVGIHFPHAGCGFEAIHVGHGKVDENEIGSQFLELRDSVITGDGLAANGPFSRLNNRSKDAPRCFGIIDNQNAQTHRSKV